MLNLTSEGFFTIRQESDTRARQTKYRAMKRLRDRHMRQKENEKSDRLPLKSICDRSKFRVEGLQYRKLVCAMGGRHTEILLNLDA